MSLTVHCTSCRDVLDASVNRRLVDVLDELQGVGVVVIGDPRDPDEIVCAACVRYGAAEDVR